MPNSKKPNFSRAYSKANEILVKSSAIQTFPFSPKDLVKEQTSIVCRSFKKARKYGVSVIPDIRFGDERTYEVSCAGIQKHGTIAVGSHGCIKLLSDRSYFVSGLKYVVDRLEPSTLVVYGAAPDKIFAQYKEKGIEVLQFDSDFMKSRKAVSA